MVCKQPQKNTKHCSWATDYDIHVECYKGTIPLSNEIKPFGVTIEKLIFDTHIVSVCQKVGGQANALNILKNILPVKTKEALYHALFDRIIFCCSQVWHHCGYRNTKKIREG